VRDRAAVVIPVFNEETAIGGVVSRLPRELADEIIVVDGGSRDRTAEAAREAGARVIVETRRGYGRACATGAQAARSEILAFLDGDGADDPEALPQLLGMVTSGKADLALGARCYMETGALPAHAVLGNKIAAALISARWRQPISDLPSFKVIRRDKLLALEMAEDTYGWTIELIVKAARSGYLVSEIPLAYRRRRGGESKVSGNIGTSLKASRAILSTLLRHALGRGRGEPILVRERAIVLMAKAPFPGEAKTRLAASIGDQAAAAVQRAFLQTSLETAREACGRLGASFVALMCPDERHGTALRELAPPDVLVWAQDRPGLMAGISQAFERAFGLGASAVVVGETDSPTLPPAHLLAAFEGLDHHNLVLGPCVDGGYYLVGATALDDATARALFEGEAYDSSTICQRTAARARDIGLGVALGPEWYDVDTPEDLQRLQDELSGDDSGRYTQLRAALGPFVMPNTVRHP